MTVVVHLVVRPGTDVDELAALVKRKLSPVGKVVGLEVPLS